MVLMSGDGWLCVAIRFISITSEYRDSNQHLLYQAWLYMIKSWVDVVTIIVTRITFA